MRKQNRFLEALTCCVALLSWHGIAGTSLVAQQSNHDFKDWVVAQLSSLEPSHLDTWTAGQLSYFQRQASSQLMAVGEPEAAVELWQLARERLDLDQISRVTALAESAIELKRMDLAEALLVSSEHRNRLLDVLAIAGYQQGDKSALDDFPQGVETMSFYDAMRLANVYLDCGEYEKAEAFVTQVVITEENDPRDVAALILEEMANRLDAAGQTELALEKIDKAFAIGGRQFYTGYGVELAYRRFHGTLAEDIEGLATRAEAYRGHMARELTYSLVNELGRAGLFAEAYRIAEERLEDSEDSARARDSTIALQAAAGDYSGALAQVKKIQPQEQRVLPRLAIAQALLLAGNRSGAEEVARYARQQISQHSELQTPVVLKALAKLGGQLRDADMVQAACAASDSGYPRGMCWVSALQGLATVP